MTNSFNLEESRNSWSRTSQSDLEDGNKKVNQASAKCLRMTLTSALALAVLIIIGLVVGLVLEVNNKTSDNDNGSSRQQRQLDTMVTGFELSTDQSSPSAASYTSQPSNPWPKQIGNISISKTLDFMLGDKLLWAHDKNYNTTSLSEPIVCSGDSASEICIEWAGNRRLTVNLRDDVNANSVTTCYDVEWEGLDCVEQVLTDCFTMTSSHWYGGYQDTNQLWPFERNTMNLSDFLSHDGFWPKIGNVLERYFISSSGAGIFVDNDVPLYFSLNRPRSGEMCLTAKYEKYPYFNFEKKRPSLKYTLCESYNIMSTHAAMSAMFIPRPTGTPHSDLFKYPIWSTWAQYHKDINQTNVLQFAHDIRNYNFTCAQVEIDEEWTPIFGDLVFDDKKFPNATAMVDAIKTLGFNVTLWIPPFFENNGVGYKEAESKGYLVRQFESSHVILTKWWDGNNSGILDVSNPAAVNWFLEKVENLKANYHVDSFKFDAGEMEWLPNMYSVANMTENPSDLFPREYVKMVARADDTNRQEVRCGYRNQDLPIFFRQIDKESKWAGHGSLETIIPGVLTFGIIGYPFVLPDMVGGNAYGNHPDAELYIRWMQLNAFLPGLQLSIVPWVFNSTVVDIVRTFVELHTQVSDTSIQLAEDTVSTGEPIVRPMWWIDSTNETALTCSDQFLVGDRYLVAPIIKPNMRSRDIYRPTGDWLDRLHGNGTEPIITGPTVIYNYSVPLESLAYFENIKYIHV